MSDRWTVVYDDSDPRRCSERALVLQSQDIPYELLRGAERTVLTVPEAFAERARYELWEFEQENAPVRAPRPIEVQLQNDMPGAFAYAAILLLVTWLAGAAAFSRDWLGAGRIDGELLRAGEWWRAVTALTLHSGPRHLLGNIGFGMLFGALAGRLAGSGVTWLAILLAGAAGNVLNTLLLDPQHRSIGASTAVFAALGLLAGFVWRGRLMRQDRWPWRLGPLIGGIALLAFTGTGDEGTDIGAHLAGFLTGLAAGIGLTQVADRLAGRHLQHACGGIAIALLAAAWLLALGGR